MLTRMTEERCLVRRRAWRRRNGSGTPRPTRPPTSRASTRPPRRRSSPPIAFGARVRLADVHTRGHHASSPPTTSTRPAELGYVVKLARGRRGDRRRQSRVRVHPAMVPLHHPLAAVRGSFNAVFIEGEAVGELMLLGRGAGGGPSAAAVLGDLIDAAKQPASRAGRAPRSATLDRRPIRPIDETGVAVLPARSTSPTARGARGDRRRVRPPRRLDPVDAAARARRRRPADLRHAPGPGGGPRRDDRRGARARAPCNGSGRCCASSGDDDDEPRPWPGVIEAYPRPTAGQRRARPSSRCSRGTRRCSTRHDSRLEPAWPACC